MLASPLQWPANQPRTRYPKRSAFSVSLASARDQLYDELHRMGATKVTISSNARLNLNGTISAKQPALNDNGVAVYFVRKGQEAVIACDRWDAIASNLRAIGKTVEAIRGIERWGTTEMVDAAFTGFLALPTGEEWWGVLEIDRHASFIAIQERYFALARTHHPDAGGDPGRFRRLTEAFDQARKEKGA